MSVPKHLLLHTCCAPCLTAVYKQLDEEGIKFSAFWFNPNIHPYIEYRNRLESLKDFTLRKNIPLIIKDDYGLRQFVQSVSGNIDERCSHCYSSRLGVTAQTALEMGCDAFSTTLLYSKYQKHEMIREIGIEIGELYGIKFFYRDWRPLWDEGRRLSREEQLYQQKYCGCIFSEEDRYLGGQN